MRERIKEVALSWFRTPFAPHCKSKGVGVDCVQLAFAIYQECELLTPGAELPRYTLAGMRDGEAILTAWLDASPDFTRIPTHAVEVGDICVFTFEGVEKHCGVVYDNGVFCHVWKRMRVGSCSLQDVTWSSRLAKAYRNVRFHV